MPLLYGAQGALIGSLSLCSTSLYLLLQLLSSSLMGLGLLLCSLQLLLQGQLNVGLLRQQPASVCCPCMLLSLQLALNLLHSIGSASAPAIEG